MLKFEVARERESLWFWPVHCFFILIKEFSSEGEALSSGTNSYWQNWDTSSGIKDYFLCNVSGNSTFPSDLGTGSLGRRA